VIASFLLVPFSLAMAYQNIVGTSGLPPIWARPTGDKIAILLLILFLVLPWAFGPVLLSIWYLQKRRRCWLFDRPRGQLTRGDQRWPLADVADVAIDVQRSNWKYGRAGVVLNFRDKNQLEIARFHAGKNVSLESRIALAEELAGIVAEFLQLPLRHPPPPNQGFDVVLPARGKPTYFT